MLVLGWYYVGTMWVLCACDVDTMLVLCWYYVGIMLVLGWYYVGIKFVLGGTLKRGDSNDDGGRMFPEHPSPILYTLRDNISRKGNPSLQNTYIYIYICIYL